MSENPKLYNYWLIFIKVSKKLVSLQQYLLTINFYIMAKYKLYLSSEERAELLANLRKYKSNSGKVMTSQILLHSDENVADSKMTSAALSSLLGCSSKTVERVRKSFCERGMGIFEPTVRRTRSDKKYDARVEAHLVALCCQAPPNGAANWTLQLLCDTLVELEVVESASPSSVCNVLKKTNLNPFRKNNM